MDEIPQVIQTPVENTPPDKPARKLNLRSILDVGSWVALFTLTPLFFIAFLSQNSLPGDFLYPVKRTVENTLLAAASASPTTKAFFQTDLADRRFSEAENLLLSQANTAPLDDLVAQVESTEVSISNVSDPVKQEELTIKAIAQIETYQAKLTNTSAQIQSSSSPFAEAPTQTQTDNTVSITSVPTATQTQIVQVVTTTPTPTPTQAQTVFIPPQDSQTTVVASAPIPTSSPAQAVPTVTHVSQVGTPQVEEQKRQVEQAVAITKLKLEKVKKDLEEKSKQREEKRDRENRGENRREGNNSSKED
ncbi:MAG: DUF5667 domain-containing protein [Candidatus Levyibacteriota bacterium]